MAVDSTTRRVVYAGNGKTTAFPFAFKVFEASDVTVATGSSDAAEVVLAYGTDYTVDVNADQETNPGGTVTVVAAPAVGVNLAVTSSVPYDQPMKLTPYDGFNPETLNDNSDRQCIQIQQLHEALSRAITTDATDTMTPAELKEKLLTAADTAYDVAIAQAQAAKKSAEEAATSAAKAEAGVEAARAEGDAQSARLEAETADHIAGVGDRAEVAGTEQVNRVISAGESVLSRNQLKCLYGAINYAADQASGTTVLLPAGVTYVVGLNHLRVTVNGVVLYPGKQYEEAGAQCYESNQIKLLMGVKATDTLEAWVIPTGGKLNAETGEVVPEEGAECQLAAWTVEEASAEGATINLPITYVVGKYHLRMSANGLVLMPVRDFAEVGSIGDESTKIVMKFPLAVGDEVCTWTVPYDRGTASETEQKIEELEKALAELSQKVVYKDETA